MNVVVGSYYFQQMTTQYTVHFRIYIWDIFIQHFLIRFGAVQLNAAFGKYIYKSVVVIRTFVRVSSVLSFLQLNSALR